MRAGLLMLLLAATTCSKAPTCTTCGGTRCVDTKVDSANCGACGNACEAGTRCEAGKCVAACAGLLCGDACVDARNDPNNCGGCGVVCSGPRRAPTCIGGRCVPGLCERGWRDCDFDEANGCESMSASCGRDVCGRLPDGGATNCALRAISSDGGRVLVSSVTSGLVPDDDNHLEDLFVYDVTTQRLTWMTRPVDGGFFSTNFPAATISGDGEHVAFATFVSLLNGMPGDYFYVRDVTTGQLVELPSIGADAGVALENASVALSYDGRFFGAEGFTDAARWLVRVDTVTGTFLASAATGTLSGNVALSGDGRVLGYLELLVDGGVLLQRLDVETGVLRQAFDVRDAGLGAPVLPLVGLDHDGSHASLGSFFFELGTTPIAVAGPSGLIRYPDAGQAIFLGLVPSLSCDGRVLAFQDLGSECRAVDVATGVPLELAERLLGATCTPMISGDGRTLAATYGQSVLLMPVRRP